jgi:hypothetical protein
MVVLIQSLPHTRLVTKGMGRSKGDEICALQLYPQLLWGPFHLCFFKCIGDGW